MVARDWIHRRWETLAAIRRYESWSDWDRGDRRRRPDRRLDRPGLARAGLAGRVVGIGRSEARLAEAVGLGAIDEATTDLAAGRRRGRGRGRLHPGDRDRRRRPGRGRARPGRRCWSPTPGARSGGSSRRSSATRRARASSSAATRSPAPSARGSRTPAPTCSRGGPACSRRPTARPADRLQRARSFWAGLGCRVIELDPAAHDEALALTSHLPHAVAAALAGVGPRRVPRRWPPAPIATGPAWPASDAAPLGGHLPREPRPDPPTPSPVPGPARRLPAGAWRPTTSGLDPPGGTPPGPAAACSTPSTTPPDPSD